MLNSKRVVFNDQILMIVKFHLEYIHVYMHQSVTKIVMKKENLCKLLFFKKCTMVQLHYAYM